MKRTTEQTTSSIGRDRAASSVIGVNIMVAITILLAAVLGAFALDVGQDLKQTSPPASLRVGVNAAANTVNVTHTGGESLVAEDVTIVLSDGTDRLEYISSDSIPLKAGGSFTINTNTTAFSGWSGASFSEQTGDNFAFFTESKITVTLIDTDGQKVIFETEVIA